AESSPMPKMVVSALFAAAMSPPKRTTFSAWLEPSLQIKIFTRVLSFEMMAGDQAVDDDRRADERQRHERQPDARPAEIFRAHRADLRADGRAGVHHQRDEDVHVALHRVRHRAVAGGD